MKINQILLVSFLVILFTGLVFFAGSKYQQSKGALAFRQGLLENNNGQAVARGFNNQNAANTDTVKNRGQAAAFRQTVGEIISLDDKSMTVKLADGSSRIVFYSDSTVINQSVEASKSDLKTGLTVAVHGTSNNDGSLLSENIEINPHSATLSTPANR